MTDKFDLALKELYRVFRKYEARKIVVLQCCYDREEERVIQERLLAKPLSQMTAKNFEDYFQEALFHFGDAYDFKHYLPRILELLADKQITRYPDPAEFLYKLKYAEWQNWPNDEREAVNDYLRVLWQLSILGDEDASVRDIEDYLTGLMRAGADLDWYLGDWLNTRTPAALSCLADFVMRFYGKHARQAPLNIYWKDDLNAQAKVLNWLHSSEMVQILEQAFFQYPDEDFSQDLSDAIEAIRMTQ